MANCSALQIIWADPQSAKPLDAARVLSVSLNEGISELYQAKVVLLCQRALGADELAALPGQKLRLEIEQLDSDGLVLTRYLQAVVKSAAFRAALYQGRQGESSRPVLRYDLELCSPLEAMHTHSAVRSFAGLTLPQVLRTLISPYTQRAVFDRELLNESGFDNLQYYQQQNQSDFEFMAALLLRSGINFNFVHGKEGFEPELIFSRGLRFDKGGHVYAAGQAIGGAPLKAGLEASQGGIYLENFCWKAKADRSAGQQAQLKTRLLSVSASRLSGRLPQQLEERRLLQNLKDRSRSLQYELLPKTGKLLSALSAEHSSFVLESVDGALQQELSQKMSSPLPLALLRYRYLRVSADSLPFKGGQLTESAGAKPALLFEDAVYSEGLRFDFYRWSQDNEPAVSLQLSGGYPALQLYLSSEAVFDVRSKSCYVPLVLNDSQGQGSSVYFVRLKLSEDFPEPDKWPRSADFEAGSAELSQSIFAQPGY